MTVDQRPWANVIDVRRFSTHDGSGIRTTVFLKGCTLACAWCQNPEAISGRIRPVFFPTRCVHCGLCVENAAAGEARWGNDRKVVVDTTRHADWAAQAERCPSRAITFDGQRHNIDNLVERALRDRVFYGQGGGVTVSGGEPLCWPHFTSRLLERLQQEGVHTAIETALDVRREFVVGVLPFADLIYADLKHIDPATHRRLTGRDNVRIRENHRFLLTSVRRHDVIVRTPLIPNATATDENIRGIAAFISGLYPEVRYELLNYNPLAAAKYRVIPDRNYIFTDEENPKLFSRAQMDHFRAVARDAGVRNIVIE